MTDYDKELDELLMPLGRSKKAGEDWKLSEGLYGTKAKLSALLRRVEVEGRQDEIALIDSQFPDLWTEKYTEKLWEKLGSYIANRPDRIRELEVEL